MLIGLWVRASMDGSQAFVEQVEHGRRRLKLPVREGLTRHPKAYVYIVALRLAELFTMYIVTAFALSYSTSNLGMSRDLFLNIGLLVGALSGVTIPCFAWLADRFGLRRVSIAGALVGLACAVPFFVAREARDRLDRDLLGATRERRARHGGECPAAAVHRAVRVDQNKVVTVSEIKMSTGRPSEGPLGKIHKNHMVGHAN
ncbi:sugar (and other) transporter family protein (plasmid) [Burkholderia humptydooensis]|uniref:Shikimate transporter n=1 Tax=Burkholderia humptydooensis MSMB43 TaxID=441157 RepID=A0ABN0FZ09_9BURK|nr:sugar (and other) transporter family protein [Burkholderia sp. 2002721687]EIP85103.1 shikimate transporter [Burkholderia humptydooensis MSMB43]